jgi:hypothetical protein
MYFPRNWEFGSALSKFWNFWGVEPPQPPLSVRQARCEWTASFYSCSYGRFSTKPNCNVSDHKQHFAMARTTFFNTQCQQSGTCHGFSKHAYLTVLLLCMNCFDWLVRRYGYNTVRQWGCLATYITIINQTASSTHRVTARTLHLYVHFLSPRFQVIRQAIPVVLDRHRAFQGC